MKLKIKRKTLRMAIAGGVLAAGVAVPTFAIVACGSSSKTTVTTVEPVGIPAYTWAGPNVTAKKVLSIMPDPENPRYQRAALYLGESGKEAKLSESVVQIKKTTSEQENIIGSALDKDGYILGGSENSTFTSYMKTIGDDPKKAPIVAYDRLLNADTATYNWYVTFQTKVVGRMQGLSIINRLYGLNLPPETTNAQVTAAITTDKKLKSVNKILAVAGSPADNNAKDYLDGAEEVIDAAMSVDSNLQKANGVGSNGKWDKSVVSIPDWNYDKGRAYMADFLAPLTVAARQQITAILAPNDGMALSAISAAREAGLDVTKVWITGQDANDSAIVSIANGTGQDMTVAKPDYALARVAMAVLAKLMETPGATPQDVLDSVTQTYSQLGTFKPVLDTTNYKTPSGRLINAILLYPIVITKANVADNFKITTTTT